ncbi:hypothetical protein [Polymorphobacter megasporae]|uniref:hypothetical protein n=1 Tax=Glacieibacterium megasporae TaxID=2835787 RepID=UPI001C1E459B|nr:hypothetical protein [Polymorphobacter megasporae]UAJ08839.1 hypothetical protein KTC28_10635 [Polymorphobacter megasporae]
MRMLRRSFWLAVSALSLTGQAFAADAPTAAPAIDITAVLARATLPFELKSERLSGAGADFLLDATKHVQFVLAGENPHDDHLVPMFDRALYRELREHQGFRYAVVEQDPMAIETLSAADAAGNPQKMATALKPYPTMLGFASDEDLAFLGDALSDRGVDDPVWGVEQAQGAVRYLEKLAQLAPTPALRTRTDALLREARSLEADRKGWIQFFGLHSLTTLPALQHLRDDWSPAEGTEADLLLTGMIKSSEIYTYAVRAQAGEPVGLYNNTTREAWLKQGFMRHYRRASTTGAVPKVLAKFGAWHMYHGRSPGSAWTFGNFLHEFAIANGSEAFGIYALASEGPKGWEEIDAWLRPLLPRDEPVTPLVIDLAALRPFAKRYVTGLSAKDADALRDLIHGYEALVVLPHSKPATFGLTGYPHL